MDLFSFLEDGAQDVEDNMETDAPSAALPHKRKASPKRAKSPALGDNDEELNGGPSQPKKPRLASPKPIVLDDLEIEAKRDIAASAGLTGSVEEGSRLELKHQVSIMMLHVIP